MMYATDGDVEYPQEKMINFGEIDRSKGPGAKSVKKK